MMPSWRGFPISEINGSFSVKSCMIARTKELEDEEKVRNSAGPESIPLILEELSRRFACPSRNFVKLLDHPHSTFKVVLCSWGYHDGMESRLMQFRDHNVSTQEVWVNFLLFHLLIEDCCASYLLISYILALLWLPNK